MNNIEIINLDPVYGSNASFDDEGNYIKPVSEFNELTSEEKLCFSCPLSECVEEAKEGCIVELRSIEKRINSYNKKLEEGTITVAGSKKLSTLSRQFEVGMKKYKEGVALKIGATVRED